jgi:hypothetical protein
MFNQVSSVSDVQQIDLFFYLNSSQYRIGSLQKVILVAMKKNVVRVKPQSYSFYQSNQER